MRGFDTGMTDEDLPRRSCARCDHFGIDADPGHHLIGGKWLEGWVSRCDFDPARKNARHVCDRFEDRYEAENSRRRAKYGYDKPSESTAGAEQSELFVVTEVKHVR